MKHFSLLFISFQKKPEDPFEFVNEIYLKAVKVKEMQRKVEERVFLSNILIVSHSDLSSDWLLIPKEGKLTGE